jgi:HK97 gp10 family phage protein
MATTNPNLSEHVRGLRDAKAAFQALPQIVRDNLGHATEVTVREIARGAQARLASSPSIVTRNLYNHVGWSYTKTNGRGRAGISAGSTTVSNIAAKRTFKVKGVVMSRGGRTFVDRPSRRAHFVEFGTRNMPAEPFMIPAAHAEKQPYLDRCRAAGKGIEKDTAAIGLRNA